MSIPTSTSVVESAVIKAPLSHVWHHIKRKSPVVYICISQVLMLTATSFNNSVQNFSDFWSSLKSSEFVKGSSDETDIVHWVFSDGHEVDVKQEEHSTINHYITYSIITAKPALSYTSVLSTIRCYAITSGELEGSTFVEWSGNFSSDADAGVIQDAKFKRRDALADLAKVAVKK
ncbi:hypothetical protein GGR57DRAFT_508462 [Xylariaceae sp. FL1272]|nr:hypothetical protein GGR57DRAFT_508462 [Xylariaceae sp. FL1272]